MEKRFPSYFRILSMVILSTAFIMFISQLGAYAYEKILQPDQKFTANTLIGSVQVSGESKKQATEHLLHSISDWQTTSGISLTFADQKTKIPMGSIHFNPEESIRNAENGNDNPLLVTITETNIKQILHEIANEKMIEDVKVAELQAEIQRQAELLNVNEQVISLTDFFVSTSVSVVASAEKEIVNTKILQSWVGKSSQMVIPAYGEFSFMNDLSATTGNWTEEFLSQAASVLYEASLTTNLQILERNTSKELPEGVKVGYEAKVNKNGMDLKFANPNDFELTVTFKSVKPGVLTVEISGYPTGRQYKVELNDSKTIPYRKIIQYTALLPNGSETIKQPGKQGYSVAVYRETYNSLNEKLDSVQISNDFYLPVNEVVLKEKVVEVDINDSETVIEPADESSQLVEDLKKETMIK